MGNKAEEDTTFYSIVVLLSTQMVLVQFGRVVRAAACTVCSLHCLQSALSAGGRRWPITDKKRRQKKPNRYKIWGHFTQQCIFMYLINGFIICFIVQSPIVTLFPTSPRSHPPRVRRAPAGVSSPAAAERPPACAGGRRGRGPSGRPARPADGRLPHHLGAPGMWRPVAGGPALPSAK